MRPLEILGTLGGPSSIAWSINASGQVVGWGTTAGGGNRAFLWENGVMRRIEPLKSMFGWAFAINTHGLVVGPNQN